MIQFKNFTAAFGEKQVVSNLNLSLKANTITAIIGASGSGKTTLLRTLCRMNDRISNFFIEGNVLIDGKDIYQSETDVRIRIESWSSTYEIENCCADDTILLIIFTG